MTAIPCFRTAILALCAVLASAAIAQEPVEPAEKPSASEPPVRLNLRDLGIPGLGSGSGSLDPATYRASFRVQEGSRRGTLSVTAEMEEGWHVYSVTQPKGGPLPTKINVAEVAEFKVLGPFQPDRPPHVRPPGGENPFKVNVEEHDERVIWTAPIELTEGVKPEDLEIAIKVDGQVCKDSCLDVDKKLTAKLAGYDAAPTKLGEYRPDPKFEAEVVLRGHIEPAVVAPGGKARLVITAEPTPGWHVYAYSPIDPPKSVAKPTLIALSPLPAGWTRSPVAASAEPTIEPAKDGQPQSRTHEESVTWTVNLTVPGDTPEGEHVISGYIGYQTCKNKGGCLPPQMVAFRASVPVGKEQAGEIPLEFTKPKRARGGSDEPATAGQVFSYSDVAKLAAASPAPTGEVDWAALVPIVGFGLLGGMILNLMPCVLPVIGLKVLSFVQQGGQSRGRVFMLNLWFAAGLILVFLLLATAAAFLNLSWGQQFTYNWFKVTMVIVVFAFALSFLGVWEVPIPGFAQTSSSDKLQKQEGLSGAFFKGIFTTLLATPCSGPFLGPVFAYTLAQPPIVTYIIFTSVGVGMAAPYLVLGAFPGLAKWLPKPGPWMETLKQLMGFVLLGTVVYLFSTINADWFIPTLALMMATWLACWIIGKVPVYEDVSKQVRAWGVGVAIAAAIGWASFTFLGPVKHLYEWEPFTPEAVAKLQSEGKTVMVDFTADWCLTCQWNFQRAINTHAVKEVVEKNEVAPVLADWTDRNETIRQKLEELSSRSIPVLAIYPAGKPGEVIVLRDVITEQQLLEALEQAGPSAGAASGQVSEQVASSPPAAE
jgi:suppressor for copper-sensitivity B